MTIRQRLAISAVCLLWLWSGGAIAEEHQHSHSSMSLDQYIARLEDPKRDEWQKPDEVLKILNLQDGQVIADIGSGSGYFTLRFAQALTPLKGRVMALDVDEGMVAHLRQKLAQEELKNVTVVHVPPHDPLLIDQSVDVVFICDTYHHIEDREIYLKKVRKGLKPNGRVVIVDFYKNKDIPVGPPVSMRLSKETVQKELQAAGLHVAETITTLPYQYILIAHPTTAAPAASPDENP
ncbi:MAG: class I SAM-dependent methyltransferase [Candidatus Binatia bacterium]